MPGRKPGFGKEFPMLFIGLVLLFSAFAGGVKADDAPIRSVGKSIRPRRDVPVRLVAEDVRIIIDSEKADVRCVFYLRNEGPPDTVEVGFPRGWEGDLVGFRAFADEELPVRSVASEPVFYGADGEEMRWWKVFEVPLGETGGITEVVNTYSAKLLPDGNMGMEDFLFTYVLTTGAWWRGTIEDVRITIYLKTAPFEQVTGISPDGFVRDNNRIMWHFRDFEPSENIRISLMQDIQYYSLKTAESVLKEEPDNAHAHFIKGAVCFIRSFCDERFTREEARKELERAVTLDPEHWDARWFLAVLYYYGGDMEKTRRQLETLDGKNPSYTCKNRLFPESLYADIPSEVPGVWLKTMGR